MEYRWDVGYMNFVIFCQIGGCNQGCLKCFLAVKNYPPVKFMLAAAATTPVSHRPTFPPPPENVLLLFRVRCWRDLLAIAKFVVNWNNTCCANVTVRIIVEKNRVRE